MNSEAEKLTLYAGQPISAVLNIHTSFHWGFDDKDQTYIMRYNVEDMARDWLVSGPKRGDFVAMVRRIELTIICSTNQYGCRTVQPTLYPSR